MPVQRRNAAHVGLQVSDLSRNMGELHLSSEPVAANHNACAYTVILATGGAGGITVTLPPAANTYGKTYAVKKVDAGAGAVTVAAAGADQIEGGANHALTAQYDSIVIVSDGLADWWIVAGWP